ncbi:MAG: hypothetical protein M3422_10335 [Actinomycetota bacterium]|nr:hypothetical protein [Actinomycetota bacterium]
MEIRSATFSQGVLDDTAKNERRALVLSGGRWAHVKVSKDQFEARPIGRVFPRQPVIDRGRADGVLERDRHGSPPFDQPLRSHKYTTSAS